MTSQGRGKRILFGTAIAVVASLADSTVAWGAEARFAEDRKSLIVSGINLRLVPGANDCKKGTAQGCDRYSLESRATSTAVLPEVIAVHADDFLLVVTLGGELTKIEAVYFEARGLKVFKPTAAGHLPEGPTADAATNEIFVEAPVLGTRLELIDPARANELSYQPLQPVEVGRVRSADPSRVEVTATDLETGEPLDPLAARAIGPWNEKLEDSDVTNAVFVLLERNLPRGKKLKVTVKGIEAGREASMIVTVPYAKAKDDATFYLSGTWVLNAGEADDTYAWDGKLQYARPFWSTDWDFTSKVSFIVGSDSLKLPNTGEAAVGLRYWFLRRDAAVWLGEQPRRALERSSLLIAPTYRTDKDFDNEQVGLDLLWSPIFTKLNRSVARERLTAENPRAVVWGWTLEPHLGAEAGQHVDSRSDELVDEAFARLLARLKLQLEWHDWTLVPSYEGRYLLEDELRLGTDDQLLTTDDGFKGYFRAELGRDFGLFKIGVTYVNGRLPPTYKKAEATTLALTIKY